MRRTLLVISMFAIFTAAVAVVPVAAQAQSSECPATLPVSQIQSGDTGYGLTVARGTTPERFDVTVVDILENAIAPGLPLIVVEVDSPEISRVGGIWAGMSGSPVYVDGKLIGAVGYGFSFGPSKLGGVTPADAMLAVPDRPALSSDSLPDSVEIPGRLQSMARGDGLTTAQARSMGQLPVPVAVNGLSGEVFERFARSFERAYPNTTVVRSTGGTSTTPPAGGMVPGGNLAVSLAYGDYTAVGVGTATTVCNGIVTGLGHPMLHDGATRMGMHSASAVRIVDDPAGTPYKLVNAGPPVGTIDQDRLAAVAGRLGPVPAATAITSSITNTDTSDTTTGRTDSVAPNQLFAGVLNHGLINYYYLVFDDIGFAGTSEVSWTIEGRRADGSDWSVTRENRHASQFDLSSESLFETASTAQLLEDNPFESVVITDVDYRATAGSPYQAYDILARDVTVSTDGSDFAPALAGVSASPGSTLTVRVPMRPYRGEVTTVDVELDVPTDASGWGSLVVGNPQEGGGDMLDCLYDPDYCAGPPADDFDDLVDSITSRSRADDLSVALILYPDFDEAEEFDETEELDEADEFGPGFDQADEFGPGFDEPVEPIASASQRLDQVVRGRTEFPVVVEAGGP